MRRSTLRSGQCSRSRRRARTSRTPSLNAMIAGDCYHSEVFCAEGVPLFDKDAYDAKYGADLWKEDIEQYDKVCKVEPFQRGLKTLNTDCMINGRTRWQGFERAWIDQFENAPIGGGLAKCNPIAYWTFEDTFDYIAKYKIPYHPSCENGYPSHGDLKDTIPVPSMDPRAKKQEEGFTAFVELRVGRRQDRVARLRHRARRPLRRPRQQGRLGQDRVRHPRGGRREDLRPRPLGVGKVQELATPEDVTALKAKGKEAVAVVYAPWCQFCQGMEEEYEKFAAETGVPVYKFRGDEEREFVGAELNTKSFPTINFISADGTATKYESEDRSVAAMAAFAKAGGKVAA